MSKYILSIDQGTTGTTALLFDTNRFEVVSKKNLEFKQIYPRPGQVEHDLNDIWSSVKESIAQLLQETHTNPADITCIGITNQRETTCAFDKDGTPLANAIVWQDRRTHEYCKNLIDSGKSEFIKNKTGLPIDPYFSATKMNWLLKNNENVQRAAKNHNLCFGTIDTYLIYKLTNNKVFATEPSNASRTLLYNIEKLDWDSELLDLFEIEKSYLPILCQSITTIGHTQNLDFLPNNIPIACVLGDQQAALFGQQGHTKGATKCTYGTGAFLLVNTGKEIIKSSKGLLSTIAYQYNNETFYALEGSCYIAGAAVQWLRDNLNLIESSNAIEELAKKVTNLDEMSNLIFFPFFTGIGSPYWKSNALASITGLTRDSSQHHIARACLEGVAFSIQDLLLSFKSDLKESFGQLNVDGGMANNNLFLEIQASISNLPIIRPQIVETTALGVALGAGLATNLYHLNDIKNIWKEDKKFIPKKEWSEYYKNKYQQWNSRLNQLYLSSN